jgi:hypothetical protein
MAISPVARLFAGQVMIHLGVENPFGQGLLQVVDQPIRIESRLGVGYGQQPDRGRRRGLKRSLRTGKSG